jgi:hypothetical protein
MRAMSARSTAVRAREAAATFSATRAVLVQQVDAVGAEEAQGVLDDLADVPGAAGDPWSALRQALQPLVDAADSDVLRATRVLLSTPSLRARSMSKHRDWSDALVPILRADGRLDETEARALVLSALACFDAALEEWVSEDGARSPGEILDRAFRAVGYRSP